jgi:hypothetical protein
MCYFIYLASPLTLSEVRSMLPQGLTADLASSADHQTLRSLHPTAVTVARILAGRCSCDLVRPRLADARADERHLRERYRALKHPRATIIASLEQHRERRMPSSPAGWSESLALFVREHARNAGPSLYFLHFGTPDSQLLPEQGVHSRTVAEVRAGTTDWLTEARPTLVG